MDLIYKIYSVLIQNDDPSYLRASCQQKPIYDYIFLYNSTTNWVHTYGEAPFPMFGYGKKCASYKINNMLVKLKKGLNQQFNRN